MAIDVPVEHIVLIDRGFDYPNKVNMPEVWNRLAKTQLDDLWIKDSMGTQYVALSLNLELTSLFLQTRISRLKIRPTLPKSSKSLIMLANMTLFASFKWLANLFGNRKSRRSWRMHMPRLIACMTWRTSLAWRTSQMFWKSERCFPDELYQAAKLLFSVSNLALLATTLIYLGENQAAVESAQKAENTVVSCSTFYLQDDADSFVQGLEAGACRMYWEKWIPTCELTIDPIVLDLTSLSLGTYLWSEYHDPCRMYFRPPDASICWHLCRRNFPPCSQFMNVAVILTKSCRC